ncbi:hypothetical protein FRX31_030246 [Thalictrum thalictroides]|uniref:Uncharacterized protein n=1 Tax=Thalictrum thalictroides TaxID=46969 RepID=A0A7J6V5A7_THATH|nr:hypothetical protein FRX31_030246 [Thalictrum thalictroides]
MLLRSGRTLMNLGFLILWIRTSKFMRRPTAQHKETSMGPVHMGRDARRKKTFPLTNKVIKALWEKAQPWLSKPKKDKKKQLRKHYKERWMDKVMGGVCEERDSFLQCKSDPPLASTKSKIVIKENGAASLGSINVNESNEKTRRRIRISTQIEV